MAKNMLFDPVPSVAPTGPVDAYQKINVSADAFGASGAKALTQVGQSLEKASDTFFDASIKEKRLQNTVAAAETDTWLARQITDKWNDYGRTEGKTALDALPKFKDDVEGLYQQAVDNAPSLEMKVHLAKSGRFLTTSYYRYATNHANTQSRKWEFDTAQRRATELGNQAVLATDYPEERDTFLNGSDDEVRKIYESRGWDQEAIGAEVVKNRGKNLKAIIETRAAEDPAGAVTLFRNYEAQMDAASRLQTLNHLRPILTKQAGRDLADEEMGRAPTGGPRLPGPVDAEADQAAAVAGIDPQLLKGIVRIESGGKPNAVKGSYKGLGQLSDDIFVKYGGGDIFSAKDNLRATAKKLADESREFDVQYGRPPAAHELYLTHQQGKGGFAAHSANPDRLAWQNMASTKEGRDKGDAWAKAAIWGNVPDSEKAKFGSVESITSKQFMDIWQRKVAAQVGGPLPDKTQVFERIVARTDGNPNMQDAALAHANRVFATYEKEQTQKRSAFELRVNDTTSEALTTGNVKTPIAQAEFIENFGPEKGARAWQSYSANVQLGADLSMVANMAPEEVAQVRARYAPQSGEGFADQTKRATVLDQAIEKARKDRDRDPAQFSQAHIPAVREVSERFSATLANPQASMAERKVAAGMYAATQLSEQARTGVAETDRRIVPTSYIETLKERLQSASTQAGGSLAVAQHIQQEAELWGDNWKYVYRQAGKEMGPLFRVIGSGISPSAARTLAELAPVKIADLFKDQNDVRAGQVKTDVLTAFKPFAQSMAGNDGAVQVFNDFREQGEKLAAYYVLQGSSSSDAAEKAFGELLGKKYDFAATYRIPKGTDFTKDQIADGVDVAKRKLADFDLLPRRDKFGGLSKEYLTTSTLNSYRRDGVWVTSADKDNRNPEVGLALVYGNEAVRRRDGSPLILTWGELAEMGKPVTSAKATPSQSSERPFAPVRADVRP